MNTDMQNLSYSFEENCIACDYEKCYQCRYSTFWNGCNCLWSKQYDGRHLVCVKGVSRSRRLASKGACFKERNFKDAVKEGETISARMWEAHTEGRRDFPFPGFADVMRNEKDACKATLYI